MYREENVLVASPEAETLTLSDYEIERNKPMPNIIHGTIQSNLNKLLRNKYEDRFRIASEVTLDLKPKATPDLIISEKSVLDWRLIEALESQMPITTIEILSPSQSLEEMAKKVYNRYFPAGIQSAWLVEPPPFKSIRVLTPTQTLYFDKGDLKDPITGIEIPVAEAFEGML